MKEISCNVIKDILPLYLDDVVSEETREMVEEHLQSCDSCREEAEVLKMNVALPTNSNTKLLDARVLKNLKKRLLKSKVFIAVVSVAGAAAVLLGIYCFLNLTELYIPYDSTKISIEEIDGKLYAFYDRDTRYMTYAVGPKYLAFENAGEANREVLICYYETLWSKYVEPAFSRQHQAHELENMFPLGDREEIDRIYYGSDDFRSMLHETPRTEEDFDPLRQHAEFTSEAEIIWEK